MFRLLCLAIFRLLCGCQQSIPLQRHQAAPEARRVTHLEMDLELPAPQMGLTWIENLESGTTPPPPYASRASLAERPLGVFCFR